MQPPLEDDDAARDPGDRAPSPSARVRLEVELLASDQPAQVPAAAEDDQRQRRTVLVVAGDADVRRYVRECLRHRDDLQVMDAATVAMAERLAELDHPHVVIVDEREAAILSLIANVPAVVIADEAFAQAPPNARIVTLLRPFGGRDLEATIDAALPSSIDGA